ncbi:MAG: protein kinase [Myxococcaceae bacterium]
MSGELVLNKYKLGNRLAVGGMGELFLAEVKDDFGKTKTVVVKALLPQLAKDPQMVAQFVDEAKLAARLKHQNLVHVHEYGQWKDTWVLAMDFVDGVDLGQVLRRSSKQGLTMPWPVAAAIIAEAANGLQFAHDVKDAEGTRLNLIHRDVSPQNILVGKDGRTRVLDFGIADSTDKSTRTATGIVKGKLAYMAPEQARSEMLSASVDQFALGLVLWELLTGRRAYSGTNDVLLLKEAIEGVVAKPTTVNPSIPANVEAVVMRMLAPKPSDRYAGCRDVHVALRALVAGDPQEHVKKFIAQIKFDDPALPLSDSKESKPRTPQLPGANDETPASGSATPGLPTPVLPKTPTGPKTPLMTAYLSLLPNGLDSFPEVQAKGSIVQSFLDGVPIHKHLAVLPPALADLVKRPPLPSAWVSEVRMAALFMACADLCFPDPDAWVEFAYRANKKIIEGPLYSVLFRVLGVKRIVSGVASRWEQFHRGTTLTVVKFDANEGHLKLTSPHRATPLVFAKAHGTAIRATVEIVGAKNVKVDTTESGPGVFDFRVTWTD